MELWILPALGVIGTGLGFAFITLAMASSLYYLSEQVEEHSVLAKRTINYLIQTVIVILVLLAIVDRFPLRLIALAILSHLVYRQNLRQFPSVRLRDPWFIASCIMVLLNHYLWFRHFSSMPHSLPITTNAGDIRYSYPTYSSEPSAFLPQFSEVASFFGICVWLAPFTLFISLSASDQTLPVTSMSTTINAGQYDSTVNSNLDDPHHHRPPSRSRERGKAGYQPGRNKGLAKALVDTILTYLADTVDLITSVSGDRRAGRNSPF